MQTEGVDPAISFQCSVLYMYRALKSLIILFAVGLTFVSCWITHFRTKLIASSPDSFMVLKKHSPQGAWVMRPDADLPLLFEPISLKNGQRLPVIGSVKGKCARTACYPIKQPSDRWSFGHVTVPKSLTLLVIWMFGFVTFHLARLLCLLPLFFCLCLSLCMSDLQA